MNEAKKAGNKRGFAKILKLNLFDKLLMGGAS